MKTTLKDAVRHVLNPLHIYCRLVVIGKLFGIDKKAVRALCNKYEVRIYRPILGL